jgi:predicted DNA-binding antitoxin AbrB/MazE fold protein
MIRTVAAVYESGVLRPLQPLGLTERQQVQVSISDSKDDLVTQWLDHEYMAEIESCSGEAEPTLDEVRSALAKISGNLSDDIRSERDTRG